MDRPVYEATLANEIADEIPQKILLVEMWEDTTLPAWEEAKAKAVWIADNLADRVVIIRSGIPIFPPCEHLECEYYDAMYRLYLVPVEVWGACKARGQ